MLTVTCFYSFHKRAGSLACSSGRCMAITALLWRSAGHAARCTRTTGTFPLSDFSSHQHGDEDAAIKGVVPQRAAGLRERYETASQFGFWHVSEFTVSNQQMCSSRKREGRKSVFLNAFVLLKPASSFHVCILLPDHIYSYSISTYFVY